MLAFFYMIMKDYRDPIYLTLATLCGRDGYQTGPCRPLWRR
jgi:hypothetical protein